jgi:hypothetical protein
VHDVGSPEPFYGLADDRRHRFRIAQIRTEPVRIDAAQRGRLLLYGLPARDDRAYARVSVTSSRAARCTCARCSALTQLSA